jgi:Flp pilus assembly protein TadG
MNSKFNSNISKSEDGFTTAWMIGLALLVVMLGLFFYDIGQAFSQRQKLIVAADRAANAGATALDEDQLIASNGSQVRLNISDAADRCRNVLIDEASNQAKGVLQENVSECNVAADGSSIEVVARGSVRFNGLVALIGSVEESDFLVESRARPSCSDATDQVTGAC